MLVFKSLDEAAIEKLLARAEEVEGKKLPLDEEARASLVRMADGDGRAALTLVEEVWRAARKGEVFDSARLQEIVQRRAPIYDKGQDGHYNLISALHKIGARLGRRRGALLSRAHVGCRREPAFIARRVVRMAVEDIGLADPQALVVALAAKDAYDFLGIPEGELAIAQAVIYCATAPKSNAAYVGFFGTPSASPGSGFACAAERYPERADASYEGEDYWPATNTIMTPTSFSGQNYFPESLTRQDFYRPVERGFEREIKKRMEYWAKLRKGRGE